MWQELRNELHGKGIEIVTVALDADAQAARAVIEAVAPSHPSLIDQHHLIGTLFGIVNVPSGIWIDEEGTIVRPPEPAFPRPSVIRDTPISDALPQRIQDMLAEVKKMQTEPEKYLAALRDWVERGSDSRYALSADEVTERSRPRPAEH